MVKTAIQNGKQAFIIDTRENDALIMIPRAYSSFVVAHGYKIDENNNISWAYGSYFENISNASMYFYTQYKNNYVEYVRRWQFIRDMNHDDIFCYGVATSEDGNFKVEFEDVEQEENYKKLFRED